MSKRAMPTNKSPYDDYSSAPMPDGGAVQDGNDPYAKSYASPYALYPSWSQEETPVSGSNYRKDTVSYQVDAAKEGLTKQGVAWYGRDANSHAASKPNHLVQINDRVQQVVIADEGPRSKDPASIPMQAQRNPTDPQNHVPDDPRIVRAGVGYTFFRYWAAVADRKLGGSADFKGQHISMADNAVVNPVGGMAPQHRKNLRNTYRIDPEPWDLNYVDLNSDPTQNVTAPTSSYVPPDVGGQHYRLG